jgi:hypothetical protein
MHQLDHHEHWQQKVREGIHQPSSSFPDYLYFFTISPTFSLATVVLIVVWCMRGLDKMRNILQLWVFLR